MFKNESERLASRKKLFDGMDDDGNGTITFNEYLKFTVQHITEKVRDAGPSQGLGPCPWQVDKQAFKQWVTVAMEAPDSAEHKELYGFLTQCFMDADADRDGFVGASEFDFLVEKAAAIPRRFGLAPSWPEQYGDVEHRQTARREMFAKMDTDGNDTIGMDEWLGFALPHIAEKVKTMNLHTMDFHRLEAEGKDAFLTFLRTACLSKRSPEYKELYNFLFQNFLMADVDQKGAISLAQFDLLVEKSAAAPRSLGLAPTSSEMFKDATERLASRRKLFDSMDADGNGTITFDEYLKFTVQHITKKVRDAGPSQGLGLCPWQVDKQAFKQWVTVAMEAPDSAERRELYGFLTQCFMDADADRDGFVGASEFDFLVEKAAALPRRFGLAPSWPEQYGDVEHRQAARREMFAKMDTDGNGIIGMDEWLGFALPHIAEKVKTMNPHSMDFHRLEAEGKDAFLAFLRPACANKSSPEYKELYNFLFQNFLMADVDRKGTISLAQFDLLVEESAAAPRSLGLAPTSSEMFKDETERLASRKKLFDGMDTDGSATITFDEYLKYTVQHITEKVALAIG
eukprot:NODE_2308_length_2240_cov_9.185991.p1 GENE.NODE_2308_length_2240_cov_9.185991~~NODE_2308_length_2240_cov_9.185991.p1  ORF type:complete len:570 (-),score=195.97 NODE_2308_length_2240_cov_9.185991:201-1910(-)